MSTYSGTKPMTYQVEPLLKRLYGHQTPKETDWNAYDSDLPKGHQVGLIL